MREISIINHLGRFKDKAPFTLAEDLVLHFNGLTDKFSQYPVNIMIDGISVSKVVLGADRILTIPQSILKAGELTMVISVERHGKPIGDINIEGLLIQGMPTDYRLSPVIAALENKIAELENTVAAQWQTHNGQMKAFSELIDNLKAQTTEAITKACSDVLTAALKATDENTADAIERIQAALDIFNLNTKKR